ncbi:MAG TPA: hypothetical protein VFK80_05840, partial [Limnochordia bacterium]|nr:hypothetical protein [Limnochordia bacterium]
RAMVTTSSTAISSYGLKKRDSAWLATHIASDSCCSRRLALLAGLMGLSRSTCRPVEKTTPAYATLEDFLMESQNLG